MENYENRIIELEKLVETLQIQIKELKSTGRGDNYHLTPTDVTIIDYLLRKRKATQKDIQSDLEIPQSSVSKSVNSLAKEGFIKRTLFRNPHSRYLYEITNVPPELR